MISDFENALPPEIKLAYLPTYGMVRLRLSTTGFDKQTAEKEVDRYFKELKLLTAAYLVTDVDDPLPVVIGKILKSKNKTISTAESCTGGYIAHLITSVPGSSAYYEGSIISYSYKVKETALGVHEKTLNTFGAVSEQTVIAMLNGLLSGLNTDYGLAISGIMGPDGGTEDKPVGTVWMAAGNKSAYKTQKINLRFNRKRNIEVTGMIALNFIRKFIVEH
jgi:nicotinamide-nucleotide amidase